MQPFDTNNTPHLTYTHTTNFPIYMYPQAAKYLALFTVTLLELDPAITNCKASWQIWNLISQSSCQQ